MGEKIRGSVGISVEKLPLENRLFKKKHIFSDRIKMIIQPGIKISLVDFLRHIKKRILVRDCPEKTRLIMIAMSSIQGNVQEGVYQIMKLPCCFVENIESSGKLLSNRDCRKKKEDKNCPVHNVDGIIGGKDPKKKVLVNIWVHPDNP